MEDAYDGEGAVPAHLSSPDFLADCAAVAAPGGVVVANLFNGVDGSEVRANVAAFAAGGWLYIKSLPHFFVYMCGFFKYFVLGSLCSLWI